MGQFVLGLFAFLAQFERAMIVARVKDRLTAARARGRMEAVQGRSSGAMQPRGDAQER